MKVPSTTQLSTWFALLLAASFRGAAAKSVLAGTHSSTANETGRSNCMYIEIVFLFNAANSIVIPFRLAGKRLRSEANLVGKLSYCMVEVSLLH